MMARNRCEARVREKGEALEQQKHDGNEQWNNVKSTSIKKQNSA